MGLMGLLGLLGRDGKKDSSPQRKLKGKKQEKGTYYDSKKKGPGNPMAA